MASLKQADVTNRLVHKFHFQEVAGGRHRRFHLLQDGRLIRSIEVPHSKRDIGNGLISFMAKQARVNQSEYRNMISCTMSEADYIERIRIEAEGIDPSEVSAGDPHLAAGVEEQT